MDSSVEALRRTSTYFTIKTVCKDDPGMGMDAIFNLRYQVYCVECGFLNPLDYPDQREVDADDKRSVHFVATNSQGMVAGTSRLVLSNGVDTFPYAEHCPPFPNFVPPPPHLSAEVSRLAVSKNYRRRQGDTLSGVNEFDISATQAAPAPRRRRQEQRVGAPLLVLGLYREMFRYSKAHGIRYWYAAMERPLVKALARYGFMFTPIGDQRDYWGPVTPYLGDLKLMEEALDQSKPELMNWFRYG